MDHVSRWLLIPPGYLFPAGPLRWSSAGDALECADGTTFALRPAVAEFIEGFGSRAPLIPFPQILQLLSLLGRGPLGLPTATVPLRRAYVEAGRPLRTAGAFCARLCERVPRAAEAIRYQDVCARLRSPDRLLPAGTVGFPERPALAPREFEKIVLDALAGYAAADLKHWLSTDQPPPEPAAEAVEEQIEAGTRRALGEVLDELIRSPGLAGAVPYVDQLLGAVTVPPRRLAHGRLPLGGYSDLANRGRPEQLLPTQLALDGAEFVRRFAENELLYFRREDPSRRREPELVAVLDQGVRTWGGVRLVLAAAVVALAKSSARRWAEFRFACTSRAGELIDPTAAPAERLAEAVSAADLSAGPAEALEPALEPRAGAPADAQRDVVLLTHPRNLGDADLRARTRRLPAGTRLFALAVDGSGRAEFSELRAGEPVPLTSFRLDLALGEAATREGAAPDANFADAGRWAGDVEVVPHPFLLGPGLGVEGELVDFVGGDAWLAVIARGGAVHLWPLDGRRGETAPRAMLPDGTNVLSAPEALLGTPDGFVVAGRFGGSAVAAHYSLKTRRCRLHRTGISGTGEVRWHYLPKLNSVAAISQYWMVGIDLATGEVHRAGTSEPGSRAEAACREAALYPVPMPKLKVYHDSEPLPASVGTCLHLHRRPGTLTLRDGGSLRQFTPESDGKPRLAECTITRAVRGGDLVVLNVTSAGAGGAVVLSMLEVRFGAQPRVAAEYSRWPLPSVVAVSRDGHYTARVQGSGVAVYESGGPAAPVLAIQRAKSHQDLKLELGHGWMILSVGHLARIIRWDRGKLSTSYTATAGGAGAALRTGHGIAAPGMVASQAHLLPWMSERFRSAVCGGLTAGVDRLGQVAMLADGRVLCMFFMFRDQFGLWMPDGTRWGPEALTGGPASPDAFEKAAAALKGAQKGAP